MKCDHGIALGSGECADCIGPLSDAELGLIRRRIAGHEGCVPRCDRAPSAEATRLLATIDALIDIIGRPVSFVSGVTRPVNEFSSPAPGAIGRLLHQDKRVMVCKVTLDPGAAWPEEAHPEHSETILRTAGRITVDLIDGPMLLVEDCFAFIEKSERHTARNASDTEPAEYISVMRRA